MTASPAFLLVYFDALCKFDFYDNARKNMSPKKMSINRIVMSVNSVLDSFEV